jgi:hypothetical protein
MYPRRVRSFFVERPLRRVAEKKAFGFDGDR